MDRCCIVWYTFSEKEAGRMDAFKYSFKDTLKENLGLAVYNTGYQKCTGRYTWGPALRDHYLVHYVAAGKGIYSCGGETHRLEQGDLFLV